MSTLTPPSRQEIREARQRLNLTQVAFAEALGVSLRGVEEWEAGRSTPPAYLRLALVALEAGLG